MNPDENVSEGSPRAGSLYAMAAAVLFGSSTPFAKSLLAAGSPWLMAGILYLGAGAGLLAIILGRRFGPVRISAGAELAGRDWSWLAGSTLAGGIVAPVLLMAGVQRTPASVASLFLNLECVATASIAWMVFGEHFDRRTLGGVILITAGGIVLSWEGRPGAGIPWSVLAIIGACLCWGIDNNCMRNISGSDPVRISFIKCAVAGIVNTCLAVFTGGAELPASLTTAAIGTLGLVSYGASLLLILMALRHIGTSRTGAYFAVAPFVGAALSVVVFGESVSLNLIAGGLIMAAGVWLHLSEVHEHEHTHELLTHEHSHIHDIHHQHEHPPGTPTGEPHTHMHTHLPMTHRHPHYPDIHHRHGHG